MGVALPTVGEGTEVATGTTVHLPRGVCVGTQPRDPTDRKQETVPAAADFHFSHNLLHSTNLRNSWGLSSYLQKEVLVLRTRTLLVCALPEIMDGRKNVLVSLF